MSQYSAITELIQQFNTYAQARTEFLAHLHRPASNRDPLAEFSEFLVARLLDCDLAFSPVQKGYDLRRGDRYVQVKYLANTNHVWVNEHQIIFADGVHEYALVVFTSLRFEAILVFPKETLTQVCKLLNKRHPAQDKTLQLTRRNFNAILSEPAKFKTLNVEIIIDGSTGLQGLNNQRES